VIPSVVENFANTAIDAMALGRLVIYGGNTGLDEVVGDAGIRVWPLTPNLLAEKMELAWNDPALAQDYSLRGQQRVRTNFDPAAVSQRRIKFYQHAIFSHRSVSPHPSPQWQALSGLHVRAILDAMIWQMSGAAGLEPQIPTPGAQLTAHFQSLNQRLKRPPIVWLFGAGRFTQRLLAERHRWESLAFKLAGIIDEHPRFAQTPSYLGLPVQNPAQLCKAIQAGLRLDAIILSTDTLQQVFRKQTQCFADLGIEILDLSPAPPK
jgi:hypothetical protein